MLRRMDGQVGQNPYPEGRKRLQKIMSIEVKIQFILKNLMWLIVNHFIAISIWQM